MRGEEGGEGEKKGDGKESITSRETFSIKVPPKCTKFNLAGRHH